MRRFVLAVDRLAAVIARLAQGLAAAACLGCLALVSIAVAARYFFDQPQAWSDEVVGWLVVATVMFAVAEAQRRGEHIGVDWLVDRWTGARRNAVLGLGALSVAVVCAVLIYEGVETVRFTVMMGVKSNALPDVPLWAIQALVPVGAGLMLVVALAQLLRWAAGLPPVETEAGGPGRHE